MKNLFTQNFGWKLLSLAAAVLIWISVATEPELATFVSAHVEYKNLSPGVEIDSDVVETVYLEVRGPSEALRLPELPRRSAVILDMAAVEPGQHTFNIDSNDVRLPRGVELLRAIPAQIRMDFEPGATRSVPVEVRFADGLPEHLQVLEATPEPSALAITGPARRVARVASVTTDPLVLKPEAGTSTYTLAAYVNDARVRFQDSPQVTVKVTVGQK
ncbi:MAG TPA: CdaR family protein [Bryobacteraceae bacterium]|nr:CdaR family protein [Bryobacteraceae bacterium]